MRRCSLLLLSSTACAASSLPVSPGPLGVPRSSGELLEVLPQPGPVDMEVVVAADWSVDRAGLINLDHPRAHAAGLEDGEEPIQIYLYALRHPTRGLYLVDTGVERALAESPEQARASGFVASAAGLDRLKVRESTAAYLARRPGTPQAVFLTHLHLDHLLGLADLPPEAPIYVGPGEAEERGWLHLFTQSMTDRHLGPRERIHAWAFAGDPAGRFAGVIDVFGDRTVWALHVPGHTAGSTAYVVRTPGGPALLVGDACHTAWGWQNGVEPGSFSANQPRSRESLDRLRALVAAHPAISVHLGHQPLAPVTTAAR